MTSIFAEYPSLVEILLTCHRRFRWAFLMIETFLACIDRRGMVNAVNSLPHSVEAMYARILRDRIFHHEHKENKNKARLMFICLAYSNRPLTLQELACAASLPDPEKVREICTSSLVSVSQGTVKRTNPAAFEADIVKFDHFSVKEYLTSEHLLESRETAYFYATPLVAHLKIAQISLSCLLSTNHVKVKLEPAKDRNAYFGEGDQVKWENVSTELDGAHEANNLSQQKQFCHRSLSPELHLLDYSIYWYMHVQQADAIDEITDQDTFKQELETRPAVTQPNPEDLRSQIHRLLSRRDCFQSLENWLNLLRAKDIERQGWPEQIQRFLKLQEIQALPLSTASEFNLSDNVRRLLRSGVSVDGDSLDSSSTTVATKPVQIAAIKGILKVLNVLLDNNATLGQKDLDLVANMNERQGALILSAILEARPQLAIENSTVIASAQNFSSTETLSYILDTPGLVVLTEALLVEIVKKCAGMRKDNDLVKSIMSHGDGLGCSSRCMLKAFICNEDGSDINFVMDRYKPPASMSQEVVKWVLENERRSNAMLFPVFNYYRDVELEFSQDILALAASDFSSFVVVTGYSSNTIINGIVMDSILANKEKSTCIEMLEMLMKCGRFSLEVVNGKENGDIEAEIEKILEAAGRWEPDAIAFLQAHARPGVTFTREIAQTTTSSSNS